MGISSLGVGSSVLTQDVLDQLKKADESQYVTPTTRRISTAKSESGEFSVISALMDNVYTSARSVTEYGVFEGRTAASSSESVATVTAADSSEIQNFSLDVSQLATKEVAESGQFASKTDKIATADGSMTLDIKNAAGDVTSSYDITYNASMTLEDLKDAINKEAGDNLSASIVQVSSGDFRLFINANKEGADQNISIMDNNGNLSDDNGVSNGGTNLTDNMTTAQDGVNAKFKYNGQDIERGSNSVSDLLSGVTITLKSTGTTTIDVKQDRTGIEDKLNNFIDKYNSALFQLDKDTKSSKDVKERGIFSGDSTVKSMKRDLQNIMRNIGSGLGQISDYGITTDNNGRLSLDTAKFEEKLDENPANVKAFFVGGTFVKSDGSEVDAKGAFNEIEDDFSKYSKYGSFSTNYTTSLKDRIDTLTEQRDKATARLTAKYATMAKRWASFDALINQLNSTSSTLTSMIDSLAAKK
jgi:flagellar hook-associated protein 2